jgi:hypothetical protein
MLVSRHAAAAAPAAAAQLCGRGLHGSAASCSNKEAGPVEKKLRQEGAGFKAPEGMDASVLKAGKKQYRCDE